MIRTIEKIQRSLVYFSLIFISSLPVYFYIYSLNTKITQIISWIILISGCLALIYLSLCLCFKGYVELKQEDNIQIDDKKLYQHCFVCDAPKPERAHHCSACRRCIKKMDHHCHWIGRCINYDNHGHFIRFLFFSNILSTAVLSANFFYIYNKINLYITFKEISIANILIFILSTIFAGLIFVVTTIHLFRQMKFVAKNVTYIEDYQCENYNCKINESPYNINIIHNIQDVFGPFYFLLLGMPQGDGISFKKKYSVMYWPKHKGFANINFCDKKN